MMVRILQKTGEFLLISGILVGWVFFCWNFLGATIACVVLGIQLCTLLLMVHAFRHAPLDNDYSNDNINTDYQDNN